MCKPLPDFFFLRGQPLLKLLKLFLKILKIAPTIQPSQIKKRMSNKLPTTMTRTSDLTLYSFNPSIITQGWGLEQLLHVISEYIPVRYFPIDFQYPKQSFVKIEDAVNIKRKIP